MGMRIHKVLGYGLQDVNAPKYNIEDDRFSDGFKYLDIDDLVDFKQWIINNPQEAGNICDKFNGNNRCKGFSSLDLLINQIKDNTTISHCSSFIHDAEFGLGSLFLICPFDNYDWYRYDDIIDYYDNECGRSMDPVVQEIKCGIFPYTYMMMRIPGSYDLEGKEFKKLEIFLSKTTGNLTPCNYNQLIGEWDKKQPPVFPELVDYVSDNFRAPIPDSVILLCHYFKVFKDLHTVNYLKPLLYTYWS